MALLYIVKYGQPVLRERAQEIEGDSPELQQLIDDMFDTMYNAPGVGLAAPQVGVGKRLFVMDPSGQRNSPESEPEVVMNPEVLEESAEDDTLEEGCLSLPGIKGEVFRPCTIRVKYLNRRFEAVERTLHDFHGRVFLHELDHLNGRLFYDGYSIPRKTLLAPSLMKIRHQGEAELRGLRSETQVPFPIRLPRS